MTSDQVAAVLRASWDDAWRGLGMAPLATLLDVLLACYAEPHRAYHTRQHLAECVDELERVATLAERPAEVRLALWFHDAIYDPRAHDNELRSARLASAALRVAGADAATADRVHDLVLATTHAAPPVGRDAQLVVDVDLAILGAPEPRFAEYERQIRAEYAWVPEPAFRERRARVLRAFLDRPSIYSTAAFATRLEARARANLTRSLEALGR